MEGPHPEDFLYEAIGSFGPWQKVVFGVFFYANLIGIWQNYAMTFLAPNVPFRCADTNHSEDQPWPGQCGEPCKKWEYNTSESSDTLVSQFDLVCDREWLISFSKSVYMIGFMASVFTFGQVSDWVGRLPAVVAGYTIACLSQVMSLFATTMEAFLAFRFLQAFGRTGYTTTGYVLVMELVGPRHRTKVGVTIQLGWCCGFLALAFVGYFFRHWFWFQVALLVPVVPLAAALLLVPESPRWLLMHHRVDRLRRLVAKASKKNGKEPKGGAEHLVKRLAKMRLQDRGTLLDLFRTPRLRWRTFNMMYLWLVNAFVYYALSFNTNDLAGDPYLNFLLAGALEFPSYGALYLALLRAGRRPVLATLMLAGGATCLALVALPEHGPPWLPVALSQAGKFCVTASFGLLYLYTGELFPTVVRSAALGSCSTVARIGSILAPFSRELGKASSPYVPNVVYCVLAVTSGLFALRLPETKGRRLPDTLSEGETFEMAPDS